MFGICRVIDIMVPDVPETLELKIKRERYLAKQALADTDTIMMVSKCVYLSSLSLHMLIQVNLGEINSIPLLLNCPIWQTSNFFFSMCKG